jgi:hypothetical protein
MRRSVCQGKVASLSARRASGCARRVKISLGGSPAAEPMHLRVM